MNKKTLLVIFSFLLILTLIIFGFKSCNPRKKTVTGEAEEYSAFINANIEFTCLLLKDPLLAQNNEENQEKLTNIYAKYKLPVDDNARMLTILQKYENDSTAATIIQQNTTNCLQGGSPIFYLAE